MMSRGSRLAAAICLALTSLAVAAPAHAYETPYYVANDNDDRCLSVANGNADQPIYGTQCYLAVKWEFHAVGSDNGRTYYQIKSSSYTEMCILMRSWGSAAYKAVLYPCMSYDDQYWYRDDGYKFVNRDHDSCMVLRSWQYYVEGSGCGSYGDQLWYLMMVA